MRLLFLALALAFIAGNQAIAAPHVEASELLSPAWHGDLLDGSAFLPARGAGAAHGPFVGNISLSSREMQTWPTEILPHRLLGHDPKVFPAVKIGFMTVGEDLVPLDQDIIRAGSVSAAGSYWDIIVQPGRLWSERGDGAWSRAAFPFALVNSLEGETHNGIAMFLYQGHRVSNVRFQIFQQTAPYNVVTEFMAAGSIKAVYSPADTTKAAEAERDYRASLADRIPTAPWSKLARRIGSHAADGFAGRAKASGIVMEALDDGKILYLKPCSTPTGVLPWCDRARFGVWSATKSLVAEIALLRLAQKYGAEVFDLSIRKYVKELPGNREWDHVSFENAIDMATGLGVGSRDRATKNPFDDMSGASYGSWYAGHSVNDKIVTALSGAHRYPWAPGEVMRYRDQDIFLLGVAMDRYLKSREGDQASIESMVLNEVFRSIGIHHAPMNRTLDSSGQPLMAFGFYPTIDEMVKIARLYQHDGTYQGAQILYAPRIREIRDGAHRSGLPTGLQTPEGAIHYFNVFWQVAFAGPAGCSHFYPRMEGWGGNVIALFPNGMNGIRIGNFDEDGVDIDDTNGMALVANRIRDFCTH